MTTHRPAATERDGTRRLYKDGHNHPVVERFGFLRRIAGPGYDVHDDDGLGIGLVVKSARGWRAYAVGSDKPLLDEDGSTRYRHRRQDAAYVLLCVAKGCLR